MSESISTKASHGEDLQQLKEQVGQIMNFIKKLQSSSSHKNNQQKQTTRCDRSISSSTRRDSSIAPNAAKRKNRHSHSETSFQSIQAEDSFHSVSRGRKSVRRQAVPPLFQIPTSNSFTGLQIPNYGDAEQEQQYQDIVDESATDLAALTIQRTKRPPPVVIHDLPVGKIQGTIDQLMVATNNRAKLRCRGKNISVITENKTDWQAVKQAVAAAEPKLQYHTYTHNEDRTKAFVMRGAHAFLDPLAIQTELLTSHGIEAKVTVMTRARRNLNGIFEVESMPLFQVLIGPEIPIERLLAVRDISHFQVTWEMKRRRGQLTQCHRCQRFGHGASNCGMTFRCVKCLESHGPGECKNVKDTKQPAICVNCGKNHPANFRECAVRLNYLARRSHAAPKSNAPREILQPSRVVDKISYAQAAATFGPTNNIRRTENSMEIVMQEIERLFGLDLFSFRNKCDNFMLEYSLIQSDQQKSIKLFSFITSLSSSK